jgi:multiple sugar transport system substrate-binding protein
VFTRVTLPGARSDVPVIYWVTDPNPAREEQINKFHNWLVKNGHTKPGDPSSPVCELRLDTANQDVAKKIIQGVSGVGGDIMDLWSGSGDMVYFADIGILHDVTDEAKEYGFDPSHTYASIGPEITTPGADGKLHQYMFPCNVAVHEYWVNKATFKALGLEPPPNRWTFDEFERRGIEFVQRANRGEQVRDTFFADSVETQTMHRSLGLSRFNETLTRCTLDDPRYVRALKLKQKWTYEDHIIPTPADIASFSTEAGYAGSTPQLFNSGNYAMFWMGRYALIQLREFGQLELDAVEPPHGGFPVTSTGSRAAAIYAGSPNIDMALLFLSFLASEDYNMHVVLDADALPPNPVYTETEAFLRPPDYPNEWGCHEKFANAVKTIAIGTVLCPFASPRTVIRIVGDTEDKFMSGLVSAEGAAEETTRRVNAEIDRQLKEDPKLRPRYEKALARQEELDKMLAPWHEIARMEQYGRPVPDDLRARAVKIPEAMIDNVFYRRYYRHLGWLE